MKAVLSRDTLILKFPTSLKQHLPILFVLLYALLRLLILLNYPLHYTPADDAYSYLLNSMQPLTQLSTYYSMPLTYLLVLKLARQNMSIIFAIQLLASISAWWTMALFVYKQLQQKDIKFARIAAFSLLLFSCSLKISEWDALVLTESLTLSLFIFYIIAYFSFLMSDGQKKLLGTATCLIMLLLLFQRTANAYLLIFCIPLYLIQLVLIKNKTNRLFCLLFITISLVGFSLVNWSTNNSGIWKSSMGNILSGHVAHYPEALDYFSEYGMPDNIRNKLEGWVDQPYYMGVKLFSDPETQTWMVDNSRKLYTKYLLTHPSYLFSPFSLSLHKPNNLLKSVSAISHSSSQYARIYATPKLMLIYKPVYFFTVVNNVMIVSLLFALIYFSIKYWRYLFSPIMLAALYYAWLSLPLFLFIWHADAGEPDRHQLIVYVNMFVAPLLCLVVLRGRVLENASK